MAVDKFLTSVAEEQSEVKWMRRGLVLALFMVGYFLWRDYRLQGVLEKWKGPRYAFVDARGYVHPAVEFDVADARFRTQIEGGLVAFSRLEFRRRRESLWDDQRTALLFVDGPVARERLATLQRTFGDLKKESASEFELQNVSTGSLVGCGQNGQKDCEGSTVEFSLILEGARRKVCAAHLSFKAAPVDAENYVNTSGIVVTNWWEDCGPNLVAEK